MRNLLILSCALFLGAVSVAGAQSNVAKDDAALAKAQSDLEKDRAEKAQDKASGNWAGQAFDSVAIGYDHTFKTEKSGEKSADTVIKNHSDNQ